MPSVSTFDDVPSLRQQLIREACSMVRHLVTNGIRVPAHLVQTVDQYETAAAQGKAVDMAALASTHERLSRLVAPARPGTLYLLDYVFHQQERGKSSLGPVKLVQDLVRVAMVCVAVFIALSVVAMTDAHPDVVIFKGKLIMLEVVLERVFWLVAAGIGAAFAMLFQINDQIVSRTFDPDETASIWVKFFLGVVAGFILVALVPIDHTADTGAEALGPPTIALLGGFSASAVYRILTRMVEALESVFTGGAKEHAAAVEKSAATRAAEESAQGRMAMAGKMVQLQQMVAAGATPEHLAEQLRQVTASLMPGAVDPLLAPSDATQPDAPAAQPDPSIPEADAAPGKVAAFAVVAAPQDAAAPADAPVLSIAAPQPEETVAASG